jgi:hypothetical protein
MTLSAYNSKDARDRVHVEQETRCFEEDDIARPFAYGDKRSHSAGFEDRIQSNFGLLSLGTSYALVAKYGIGIFLTAAFLLV